MNIYKIYYRGAYKVAFYNRDAALNWVVQEVDSSGADFGDFEILDGSDAA